MNNAWYYNVIIIIIGEDCNESRYDSASQEETTTGGEKSRIGKKFLYYVHLNNICIFL